MNLGEPALRVADVQVELGGHVIVVDASFELQAGSVTALVGPNGSGKTTMLRALARLVPTASGLVSLPGNGDTRTLSARDFATRVGLLAQQRPTPAGITVRDIVTFGRHPHRRGWRGQDQYGAAAIEKALDATGLIPIADAMLETLSGGQLQRAWFASALAQDTAVLLLDEPTNHLDLRYQVDTLHLIEDLAIQHGVAVGVVLHELNHAAQIADRVLVLSNGRIVADGPPERALNATLLSDVYQIPIDVSGHGDSLEVRPRRRIRRPVAV